MRAKIDFNTVAAVCPGDHVAEVIPINEEPELLATNGEHFPWDDIRLPRFVTPVRYDIQLTPNLTSKWVMGIEKLIFTVKEETNFIVFHAKNITITSRTIRQRLNVQKMLEYPHREQIYLETDDYMIPGVSYAVRLKFQYKLSDQLEGFYLSRYKDAKGEERVLATSHFEPTYARRAFPCFDEPDLKAKFLVTIIHDPELVAFFNTPKAVSEVRSVPSQLIRDEFEETVEMSTYLVAFVVCDFVAISQMSGKGVNVSVIAAEDKIGQAGFALDSAVAIMDYYHDFFGVPYPLPKQGPNFVYKYSDGYLRFTWCYTRRLDCYSRFRRRRHGELGPDHLPRDFSALFGGGDERRRQAVDRHRRRARARPPVVR